MASGPSATAASMRSAPSTPPMADSRLSVKARLARIAGAQQDGEVADFLGDLVGRDRDRGGRAERNRGQHGGRDQRAVDEGVEGVADDDQRRGAAGVDFAVVAGVAVAPQHQLLEQEEGEHAASSVPSAAVGGSDRSASGSSASSATPSSVPDRIADQPGTRRTPEAVAEKEKHRSRRETADATQNAEPTATANTCTARMIAEGPGSDSYPFPPSRSRVRGGA